MNVIHAGPPDPTKTEFNDQNKMFTIQKFGKQTITLTPKDRYGNIISSSDGFAIQIKKVRQMVGCSPSWLAAALLSLKAFALCTMEKYIHCSNSLKVIYLGDHIQHCFVLNK